MLEVGSFPRLCPGRGEWGGGGGQRLELGIWQVPPTPVSSEQ